METFERNCPQCTEIMQYRTSAGMQRSESRGLICKKCRSLNFRQATLNSMHPEFLKLYNEGRSDRQIAILCGVKHHGTIQGWRLLYNLAPNIPAREKTQVTADGIVCSICKTLQPETNFQVNRRGRSDWYMYSFCNACRKKKVAARSNGDVLVYLKNRYKTSKGRALYRKIPFSISRDEFISIFLAQEGKCFYTGKSLLTAVGCGGRNPDQCSADRMDNSVGYTKENVVFCTRKINGVKSDLSLDDIREYMPGWYAKIKDEQAKRSD